MGQIRSSRSGANGESDQLPQITFIEPLFKPFMVQFPRADPYKLVSFDLLHQIIKGSFKDHLVTWVGDYLEIKYGKRRAAATLDIIDRRSADLSLCGKALTLFL